LIYEEKLKIVKEREFETRK